MQFTKPLAGALLLAAAQPRQPFLERRPIGLGAARQAHRAHSAVFVGLPRRDRQLSANRNGFEEGSDQPQPLVAAGPGLGRLVDSVPFAPNDTVPVMPTVTGVSWARACEKVERIAMSANAGRKRLLPRAGEGGRSPDEGAAS